MQLVRAKNNKNKLEVFDNRLFAIEIELMRSGFKVLFEDLKMRKKYVAAYANRELFDKEWELCEEISNNEESVFYEVINYYQE